MAKDDEIDYPSYADKAATDLQERFAEWIPEVTGYDPSAAKSKGAAFDAGVRLAVALRIPFQRSDENQSHRAQAAAAREAAAAEPKPEKAPKAPKAEKVVAEVPAPKPAKKGKAAKVAAAVAPEAVVTETVTEAKPKRGPRKTAATKVAPF